MKNYSISIPAPLPYCIPSLRIAIFCRFYGIYIH